jgi:hypothetical protein
MAHINKAALVLLLKEILEDDLDNSTEISDNIPVLIACAAGYGTFLHYIL